METKFNQQMQSLLGEVRETLENKLGVHVQELAQKVDELTSGLNACNEMRIKTTKRTRQILDTINQKMKTNNRKMIVKHKMLKKKQTEEDDEGKF